MYSLPERAAENIPYTWQHWLKIAHKPLIHHYRIFAQQAWDPQSLGSRFDVSSLLGYLIPTSSSSSSNLLSWFDLFLCSLLLCLSLPLFLGFTNKPLMDFIWQCKQESQQEGKPFCQFRESPVSILLMLTRPSTCQFIDLLGFASQRWFYRWWFGKRFLLYSSSGSL